MIFLNRIQFGEENIKMYKSTSASRAATASRWDQQKNKLLRPKLSKLPSAP